MYINRTVYLSDTYNKRIALKRKIPTSGTIRCTRQRSRPSRPITTQSSFQLRVADRLPSPPLRNSSFRNGCINRRPESRPQWILIISGHVHTMCTPIFIPKSLEGFYEETIQCSENGDYSAWGGLWDAYWGRPQADPERSSRQVGRRRCKDDVDIGRSARGLKLCSGQSFVTMAHWARDLTPRDPTNTPRRHVITLSISY